jgi:hypothetical protein
LAKAILFTPRFTDSQVSSHNLTIVHMSFIVAHLFSAVKHLVSIVKRERTEFEGKGEHL